MKIALDLRFYRKETAGLGRYSRNLLKELLLIDKQNQYTAIITLKDEPEFEVSAPNLQVKVIEAPHYSLAEQWKLWRYLQKEKFDLVHFANFNHPILYRGRFVVTIHDLIQQLYPTGGQKSNFIKALSYRLSIRHCKKALEVITPSQSTKNDLMRLYKFKEEKIKVIFEGAEDGFRVANDEKIAELKKRLSLPKKYFLFVSRWANYKGLQKLIEAYGLIKDEFSDVGLVIVGRPDVKSPEVEHLVKEKQALGWNIVTPGFVEDSDLPVLYSGATALVHPSLYEGFGIMILEAFASGTMVISSNRSSLPEVVGEAGALFDPTNTEELVELLKKSLNDNSWREDLIKKGLARVKEFSWAKMAKETLEIYEEAAGRNDQRL